MFSKIVENKAPLKESSEAATSPKNKVATQKNVLASFKSASTNQKANIN